MFGQISYPWFHKEVEYEQFLTLRAPASYDWNMTMKIDGCVLIITTTNANLKYQHDRTRYTVDLSNDVQYFGNTFTLTWN